MRTPILSSVIFSVALVSAMAHAQPAPEATPTAPDAASDAAVPAEGVSGGTAEPTEAREPAESAATSPEAATEPTTPPPPPAAEAGHAGKAQASPVVVAEPECPKPPQKPGGRVHDGFYLRASLGHGLVWTKFSDGLLADGSMEGDGGSFDLQLGGSIVPGFVVGGGLFLSGMDHEDVRAPGESLDEDNPGSVGMLAIGPFVDYYPDPEGGFHFGGMLGIGGLGFETADQNEADPSFDEKARGGGGGAIAAWVGYDWWVAREWSLGAQLRYMGVAVENQDYDWTGAADAVSLQFTALYN